MEYAFIGGSMGAVVGEMITRAVERALAAKMPLIIVSASGGARMMEGVISLMQLAKISAALAQLDRSQSPLHFCVDRSDHRRRDRIVRHAGRFEYRRTRRADRLCRAAGDRANHPAETAGGFPAQRISAGARHAGRRGPSQGNEAVHCQGAGLHGGSSGQTSVQSPASHACYPHPDRISDRTRSTNISDWDC